MPIRLAIADDHNLVRAGLVEFLGASPGMAVVIEAADGKELLEKLPSNQVDLVLLDLNMPGLSGTDLISHIKNTYPDMLIMVLSGDEQLNMVRNAISAGASGYICKSCLPQILLDAISKIIATGKYLSPLMSKQLVYTYGFPDAKNTGVDLSSREMEILRLIVEGKSINEIASQLFISNKTVSTHKHNMLKKLELNGIADLVRYAMEHKIFQ